MIGKVAIGLEWCGLRTAGLRREGGDRVPDQLRPDDQTEHRHDRGVAATQTALQLTEDPLSPFPDQEAMPTAKARTRPIARPIPVTLFGAASRRQRSAGIPSKRRRRQLESERMSEPIAADVTERTTLAGERTLLAWWRTGLAGLAVAIAVGRVVPELSPASEEWPYTLLGIAYAVYGIALIVYGTARGRDVQVAAQRGELSPSRSFAPVAMAVAGVLLGLGTIALIVIG
jgi:putative membrane protein